MLKAYAVALTIATATPVADNQKGVDQIQKNQKEAATQTQLFKPESPKKTGTF